MLYVCMFLLRVGILLRGDDDIQIILQYHSRQPTYQKVSSYRSHSEPHRALKMDVGDASESDEHSTDGGSSHLHDTDITEDASTSHTNSPSLPLPQDLPPSRMLKNLSSGKKKRIENLLNENLQYSKAIDAAMSYIHDESGATIEDSAINSRTKTSTNTLRHSQLFTENRQPKAKHELHINKIVDASHKIFDHERRQYIQDLRNAEQKLVAAKKPDTQFQALQFIGKSVESDSGKILRAEGDDTHEIRFNVAKAAKDLTVDIKNEDGDVIKSYKLQQLEQGQNSITWNGLNAEDKPARAGNYKVEVSAVDEQDQKIVTSTKISGTITGVNYTANGPMLMIGNQSVPMSEVRKIVDPKAGPVKGTDVKDVTKLALNNDDKVKDTENKPKASEQLINDVPMARGLLNKVKSGKE